VTFAYQYIFTMSGTAPPPRLEGNRLRRPAHLNPHNVSPPVTLQLQHMQKPARAGRLQAQARTSTNTSNTTSTHAAPHIPRARSNIWDKAAAWVAAVTAIAIGIYQSTKQTAANELARLGLCLQYPDHPVRIIPLSMLPSPTPSFFDFN
jgi:hypothetical protein